MTQVNEDEIMDAFEKWAGNCYSQTSQIFSIFKAGYTAQKMATPEMIEEVASAIYLDNHGIMNGYTIEKCSGYAQAALRALGYVMEVI
jgi:hypothetical protein